MNQAGSLYVVATPIGNLGDISPRALEILKGVSLIAAEDTRHTRKLLQHFDIHTPLLALHEHNERTQTAKLLKLLKEGEDVALVSDAGTPLISDPGQYLVSKVCAEDIAILAVPGPCAAIAALSVSGLTTGRFVFEGFLPAKAGQREVLLQELKAETRTLVFYESPHRLAACLSAMHEIFGASRRALIAKEITKLYETYYRGSLEELESIISQVPLMGEFVIIVEGHQEQEEALSAESLKTLELLLAELPVQQAVRLAAAITGEKKNRLYKIAISYNK